MQLDECQASQKANILLSLNIKVSIWKGENSHSLCIKHVPYNHLVPIILHLKNFFKKPATVSLDFLLKHHLLGPFSTKTI